jgi:hypothetical protein
MIEPNIFKGYNSNKIVSYKFLICANKNFEVEKILKCGLKMAEIFFVEQKVHAKFDYRINSKSYGMTVYPQVFQIF